MSTPLNDRDLEHYLQRNSALSQEYRNLSDEKPPTELQRAVLVRARDAVERERLQQKPPPPKRWLPPFTLAATIVISFSIVLAIGLQKTRLLPGMELRSDVPEPIEDAVTFLLAPLPEALPETKVDQAVQAPRSTSSLSKAAPKSEGALTSREANRAPAETLRAPAQSAAGAMSDKASDAAGVTATTMRSPQVWLANIEALNRAGEVAKAEQELAAFRRAYPDYELKNRDTKKP